jgi:hypothetical protein
MKKEIRLIYPIFKKNPDKKWWQLWKEGWIMEKHILKVNKKGEIILGEKQ